jgi:O-antigen/teichoic acid export membrane protein
MGETSAYGLPRIRRGLVQFAVGKSVTASLGFAAFALTAIVLPVADYGGYVTLVAALDLMVALSTFGVDWVAVRFIPEYRTHGSGASLKRFIALLIVVRIASLAILALAWWIALAAFLSYFRIEDWHAAAMIYLFVLMSEGLARFLRDHVLDSLLMQGLSQLSLATRSGTIVSILAYCALAAEPLSLTAIAALELAASVVGLATAVCGGTRYFRGGSDAAASDASWMPPSRSIIMRLAWHSYVSMVIALLYGTQALMMLASRMLGIAGAAVFGFARNLAEQVRRYLPASLFIGLVRPAIIARYTASGDFSRLNRHAVLVYKLSLFALAPVLVFVTVFGQGCLDLLSGGKYGGAHAYAVGLLLVLVPFSHRQVLEMVANTINRPELWSRAATASLITLPLAALFIAAGLEVWGLIAAVFIAEVVANAVIIRGLNRYGVRYHLDGRSVVRMLMAALIAMSSLYAFRDIEPTTVQVGAAAAASVLAFLAIAYVIKPFNAAERDAVNRLITRPLFRW